MPEPPDLTQRSGVRPRQRRWPRPPMGLKPEAFVRFRSRGAFMLAVSRVTPEVTDALRAVFAVNDGEPRTPWPSTPTGAGARASAVKAWARRFNLDVGWVLERAWGGLHALEVFASLRDDRAVPFPFSGEERFEALPGAGSCAIELVDEWIPFLEDRPSVEARIAAKAEARLDEIQAAHRAIGYAERRFKDPRHFEWLALWQCGGCDAGMVFRRYYPDELPPRYWRKDRGDSNEVQYRAIHKALRETADLLDLPLIKR